MIKYEKLPVTFQQWQKQLETGIRTYIFHYKDEKEKNYFPCTDGYYSKTKYFPNLLKVIPFQTPDKRSHDEWIRSCSLLNKYFGGVLSSGAFEELHGLDFNDIEAIIIPKEKIDALNNLIDRYKLSDCRDLIFYLVSKIQEIYCDVPDAISRYQEKDAQRGIKGFKNECRKLIEIVRKNSEPSTYGRKGKISPLHLHKPLDVNAIRSKYGSDVIKQNETKELILK